MDPKSLTSLDWNNILVVVHALWFILISIVVFGGAFIIAHIFMPGLSRYNGSLAFARVKKGQLKTLRLFLYCLSGTAFAAAAFLATRTFNQLSSVLSFYTRFWM